MEHVWSEVLAVFDGGRTREYAPLVLLAAFAFFGLQIGTRLLTSTLAPRFHKGLTPAEKVDWDVRVVSTIFSTWVCIQALRVLDHPDVVADPVFAVHDETATLGAVAAGYFLWDVAVCIYNSDIYEAAFLAHAVACFFVYLFSLRPFLTRYAPVFLLFEASTVPLNIHWFLDRVGLEKSTLKFVNAVLLMIVFFIARICFGLYSSYSFFNDVFVREWHRVPVLIAVYYGLANILLNGLNIVWFRKMVRMAINIAKGKERPSRPGSPNPSVVLASRSPSPKPADKAPNKAA